MTPTREVFALAAWFKLENGETHFTTIRTIDSEEYHNIEQAVNVVNDFNVHYSLYEICAINYTDFVSFYMKSMKQFINTHYMGQDFYYQVIQETNRLLINYLTSFRTFLDHYERRLKHLDEQGSSYSLKFKNLTNHCFDNSFAYRFFSKLRNYVQHCGLPTGGINYSLTLDHEEKPVAQFKIYFNRDKLLQDYDDWGKIVRPDLIKQPEQMDIFPLVNELQSKVEAISLLCTEIEFEIMRSSWFFALDRIEEILVVYPKSFPCAVRLIDSMEGKKQISELRFPIYTMRKIEGWAGKAANPEQT